MTQHERFPPTPVHRAFRVSGILFANHPSRQLGPLGPSTFLHTPPPTLPPCLLPSSRESFRIFQKLSEIFSDENNYSLSRELLIKVESGVRERVASHSL